MVFTIGMPGTVAGTVPFLITRGWQSNNPPLALQIVGVALLSAGIAVLVNTIIRFVVEGMGTPFPGAPTQRLVVGGLYRYVRNPMYLAVISTIAGQAGVLGSPTLVVYAAIVWATVAAFVHFYEEPTLAARYGAEYTSYRSAVRAWIPRTQPWPS